MKRVLLYSLIILTRIIADIPILWMFYFLHFQKEGAGGIFDAVFNAALFFIFALSHSLLSRNFAKTFLIKLVSENYVRIVYVYTASITLFLMLYFWRPIAGIVWRTEGVFFWILSILYVCCIAGMILTANYIDFPEFLGIRIFMQKSKNQSAKPPVFSVKGPYAYCRHPMYLLLVFALWAAPVMTFSRLEFALLGSIYLVIGTFFEERNLGEELGEIYDRYRKNVPMWIPRLRPWEYK